MERARWVAEKRAEIATLADLPLPEIVPSRRDFTQFVATQKQGIALVPRLHRANPGSGRAWPALDLVAVARACDDSDAAALAVRTAAVFGNALADLDAVAKAVSAPLLRDDLCLHERHVLQSRLHGADAVLLPAVELDPAALRDLSAVASSMHMTSVIEVGSEVELRAALQLHTACIGIAGTERGGRADLQRVRELASQVPRQRTVVLLDEVAALDELLPLSGVIDAAVVGDALLDVPDPAAAIAAFQARLG